MSNDVQVIGNSVSEQIDKGDLCTTDSGELCIVTRMPPASTCEVGEDSRRVVYLATGNWDIWTSAAIGLTRVPTGTIIQVTQGERT